MKIQNNITFTFEELEDEIQKQGPNLFFNTDINFNMLKLPEGIQSIIVDGEFSGNNLTEIISSISIKATGAIRLGNLISLGNHVVLEAGYSIFLNSLNTLSSNITIKAGWDVFLDNLIAMADNIYLKAGEHIWFYKLTTMGDNITINTDKFIWFNGSIYDLRDLKLIDNSSVSNTVIQFLITNNIHLRCKANSPLVNLAFDGVNVEIIA